MVGGYPLSSERISIHSLRMEGDLGISLILFTILSFQSTPSAWRETSEVKHHEKVHCISIHSLRMEGDLVNGNSKSAMVFISIHSLRMEGDIAMLLPIFGGAEFQSTPSAWRETSGAVPADDLRQHFNPLPPHGGRHALQTVQKAF